MDPFFQKASNQNQTFASTKTDNSNASFGSDSNAYNYNPYSFPSVPNPSYPNANQPSFYPPQLPSQSNSSTAFNALPLDFSNLVLSGIQQQAMKSEQIQSVIALESFLFYHSCKITFIVK